MINPLLVMDDSIPIFPLKECKCTYCGLAVDSNNNQVYCFNTKKAILWSEVVSEPGWNNGWPPGMGPSQPIKFKIGQINTWNLVYPTTPDTVPVTQPETCDCGAAAADYTVSRVGGPGHSDWCKVYEN